jgi:hypothetical protein
LGVRTITIRVPRPDSGWHREADDLFEDLALVRDDTTLYLLLRRIREKALQAESGGLVVAALSFEFSVDGAYALWEYLGEGQALTPLLRAIYDRLRDALDDHEEAQRDREAFDRFRRRAFSPADPVRERWEMADGGTGPDGGEPDHAGPAGDAVRLQGPRARVPVAEREGDPDAEVDADG